MSFFWEYFNVYSIKKIINSFFSLTLKAQIKSKNDITNKMISEYCPIRI